MRVLSYCGGSGHLAPSLSLGGVRIEPPPNWAHFHLEFVVTPFQIRLHRREVGLHVLAAAVFLQQRGLVRLHGPARIAPRRRRYD